MSQLEMGAQEPVSGRHGDLIGGMEPERGGKEGKKDHEKRVPSEMQPKSTPPWRSSKVSEIRRRLNPAARRRCIPVLALLPVVLFLLSAGSSRTRARVQWAKIKHIPPDQPANFFSHTISLLLLQFHPIHSPFPDTHLLAQIFFENSRNHGLHRR